jgi:hypothetical protein
MRFDFEDFLVLIPETVAASDTGAAKQPDGEQDNDNYPENSYSTITHCNIS